VVIAISSILASMLLPALTRAKSKARMSQCLNNFRQIAIGFALYTSDQGDRFPSFTAYETNGTAKEIGYWGIGGKDVVPTSPYAKYQPSASIRPLYTYLKAVEVFHCPVDELSGQLMGLSWRGSTWDAMGCSYGYQTHLGNDTLLPQEDPQSGLAGKTTGWVPNPSLFIEMNEASATILHGRDPRQPDNPTHQPTFYFTHESSRATKGGFGVSRLAEFGADRFISPVLFVDGHAARHDFTKVIRSDPKHCNEPTGDWVWYKPRRPL
jgi:hypothetical protein